MSKVSMPTDEQVQSTELRLRCCEPELSFCKHWLLSLTFSYFIQQDSSIGIHFSFKVFHFFIDLNCFNAVLIDLELYPYQPLFICSIIFPLYSLGSATLNIWNTYEAWWWMNMPESVVLTGMLSSFFPSHILILHCLRQNKKETEALKL